MVANKANTMNRVLLAFAIVTLIGYLGPVAFPIAVYAQQPSSLRRIGVLLVGQSAESKQVQEFRQGLSDAGYAEGHDVVVEWRSASGDYDRLTELAADLAQRADYPLSSVTVEVNR